MTKNGDTPSRITRRDTSWENLFEALVAFAHEEGHCNVPLNYEPNPTLGRWVATQRFRKKINALPPDRVKRLSDIGFIWSVTDLSWERMFSQLVSASKRLGHCNIPAKWPENPKLATWVTNQRYKGKHGTLAPDRMKRLEKIGFCWSARPFPCKKKAKPAAETVATATDPEPPAPDVPCNDMPDCSDDKLYNLAPGVYIQHNHHDPLPAELSAFIEAHGGEMPPYIPLPSFPVNFLMGNPFMVKRRRIPWPGHGKLNAEILEYVVENGVLPEWETNGDEHP